MKSGHPKRELTSEERKVIRAMIEDGAPREKISDELLVSFNQINGFVAHVRNKWLTPKEMVQRAHNYARARARLNGWDCLGAEECENLLSEQSGRCALTGFKFSNKIGNKNGKILRYPYRPSLDRRANTKGYEKSNVRLVTQWANFAKGEWTEKTFVQMCRAAADYKK